jgi:ketosteroid isomerase-like protein
MKMRTVIKAAALVLALGATACGGATEAAFGQADSSAIRKATSDLTAAINAKNVEQILSLYADNSVFMPPNAPLLRGRDPLKSFYTDLVNKVSDIKLEPVDVAGHGPIAYESGTYTMNLGTTRDRGKFLFVLRNMAGNWRFEYTSWSSDLPRPAAN